MSRYKIVTVFEDMYAIKDTKNDFIVFSTSYLEVAKKLLDYLQSIKNSMYRNIQFPPKCCKDQEREIAKTNIDLMIHELLDRTSCVLDQFSRGIQEHPLFESLPQKTKGEIEHISRSLYNLYQSFGADFEEDSK
jgi:regulator of sigma D